MPLILDAQTIQQPYAQVIEYASDRELQGSNPNAFETSRFPVSDVRFGNVVYPLRKLLSAMYLRAKEELLVDGLSPELVGRGDSASTAFEDFSLQFHRCVQSLIFKRDFEFSDEEKFTWKKINDVVDITVFKNRTPLVVQQYGVISHGMVSYPCKIQWDNGYTEPIDVRIVKSPDFVNYGPGQTVRAIVRRNPITREIIDIPFVEKVRSLPSNSEMEESGFVDEVLNGKQFPAVDWE